MSKVIIFGVKDTAELAHYYLTNDSNHEVVAFSISKDYMESETFHGLPVIPFEDIENKLPPSRFKFFAPMTGKGMNKDREKIYNQCKQKGYEFQILGKKLDYKLHDAVIYALLNGFRSFVIFNPDGTARWSKEFSKLLNLYDEMRDALPWILLTISFFLLITETTRLPWPLWIQNITGGTLGEGSRVTGFIVATAYFLLCGFYGFAVFSLPATSPVGMPNASLLLPSLAGLFGIANLIDIYSTTQELPPQKDDWELPPSGPLMIPCFLSSVAGTVMAVLPGMTAAQATVMVMSGRNVAAWVKGEEGWGMDFENMTMPEISDDDLMAKAMAAADSEEIPIDDVYKDRDMEIIAILSAVNTAVTVSVLGFLYVIGRSRSGATLALKQMYPIDKWAELEPSSDFVRLLAVTVAAGLISIPIMTKVGKGVLKLHEMIPLQTMLMAVIIFVTLLVWFSTGWIGIGVLIVGTVMGLMPPRIGIRRSHGMGIIIVPIMIYTFMQKYGDPFGFI